VTSIVPENYGAVGDGINDDTAAISAALSAAAVSSMSSTVELGPKNYRITSTLTVPTNCALIGSGEGRTRILADVGVGTAITCPPEASKVLLSRFTLANIGYANNGIVFDAPRNCTISHVEVLDFDEWGVTLDGSGTFAASNHLEVLHLGRNGNGLRLTADTARQCNHTTVVGGYCYGSATLRGTAGATGVQVHRGDTNLFVGFAVEDYNIGWDIAAVDVGGNVFVMPRAENCAQNYRVNSGVSNVVVVAPSPGLDGSAVGSGDGLAVFGTVPHMRLDGAYLSSQSGLGVKDSGGAVKPVLAGTASNDLEVAAPSFDPSQRVVVVNKGTGLPMMAVSDADGVEVMGAGQPVTLCSLNGTRWKVTVTDSGSLATSEVA